MTWTTEDQESLMRIRDELLGRLREEMKNRDSVQGQMVGDQPAFVIHECREMNAAVNTHRRQRGLPPLTLEDVLRVEQLACGHSDYGTKYALYCAELAMGITPRELAG